MVNVTDIKGVGPSKAENLAENGYESVEDIAQADPDALSSVKGVSEDRALEYMVSAGDLLDEESQDDSEQREEASDEFDLTPDEVGEELQDDADDAESEDEGEVEVVEDDEEESAEDESEGDSGESLDAGEDSDGGDEVDEEPTYEVTVDFNTRMEYHTFHAAIMRYHETQYTSNQPKADAMQMILDGLESGDGFEYEVSEEEFNTLHTAVKQCRTDYQGNNLIDHMDALNKVEEQINNQRRDLLF